MPKGNYICFFSSNSKLLPNILLFICLSSVSLTNLPSLKNGNLDSPVDVVTPAHSIVTGNAQYITKLSK